MGGFLSESSSVLSEENENKKVGKKKKKRQSKPMINLGLFPSLTESSSQKVRNSI